MRTWILSGFALVTAVGLASAADPKMTTKSYPVADLIATVYAPQPMASTLGVYKPAAAPTPAIAAAPQIMAASATEPAPRKLSLPPSCRSNADKLQSLVMQYVKPYSWADCGGPGKIEFDEKTMSLVVTQTADVHGNVAELIAALRNLQERTTRQILIEMRVLDVSDDFVARMKTEYGLGDKPTTFLTAEQMKNLMEAATGDRRVNVLQAPKITALDGQTACVEISQSNVFQTGLDLTAGANGVERKPRFETVNTGQRTVLTPRVSADQKFIELKFLHESASLARNLPVMPIHVAGGIDQDTDLIARPEVNKQVIETTVTIPQNRSVVIAGAPTSQDLVMEFGLPVLSRVPYVNRAFKGRSVSKESRQQLILLTARTVVEPPSPETEVAKLVREYKAACAAGRTEDAIKLAMKALALDSKCFEK